MPRVSKFSPEFKEQAVRLVFSEIGPEESRKEACERLGPRLGVKAVTLYNCVEDPDRVSFITALRIVRRSMSQSDDFSPSPL